MQRYSGDISPHCGPWRGRTFLSAHCGYASCDAFEGYGDEHGYSWIAETVGLYHWGLHRASHLVKCAYSPRLHALSGFTILLLQELRSRLSGVQGLSIDVSSAGLADSVRQLKDIQVCPHTEITTHNRILLTAANAAGLSATFRAARIYQEHCAHMDRRHTFPRAVLDTRLGGLTSVSQWR